MDWYRSATSNGRARSSGCFERIVSTRRRNMRSISSIRSQVGAVRDTGNTVARANSASPVRAGAPGGAPNGQLPVCLLVEIVVVATAVLAADLVDRALDD